MLEQQSHQLEAQTQEQSSKLEAMRQERIGTEMRIVTEALVAGRMTVEQAVTELDARTDRILEKRRWMLDQRGRA